MNIVIHESKSYRVCHGVGFKGNQFQWGSLYTGKCVPIFRAYMFEWSVPILSKTCVWNVQETSIVPSCVLCLQATCPSYPTTSVTRVPLLSPTARCWLNWSWHLVAKSGIYISVVSGRIMTAWLMLCHIMGKGGSRYDYISSLGSLAQITDAFRLGPKVLDVWGCKASLKYKK